MSNRNFFECPVCKIFKDFDYVFKDLPVIDNPSKSVELLTTNYNVLREEMFESFTRVAHARNWAILVFFGGISLLGSNSIIPMDTKIQLMVPIFSSILICLLSHFALNANCATWSLGSSLLAFEVNHGQHFSNEHASWSEFMGISGRRDGDFFEINYGVSLNHINIRVNGVTNEGRIEEYESIFNNLISPSLTVQKPLNWLKNVILDFYFWLTLFNLIVTVMFFASKPEMKTSDLYNILFYTSIVLQILIIALIVYLVRLEKISFKFAVLESVFRFIRLKRGIQLKITYPWILKIFVYSY